LQPEIAGLGFRGLRHGKGVDIGFKAGFSAANPLGLLPAAPATNILFHSSICRDKNGAQKCSYVFVARISTRVALAYLKNVYHLVPQLNLQGQKWRKNFGIYTSFFVDFLDRIMEK
jgi:hypothetical protein